MITLFLMLAIIVVMLIMGAFLAEAGVAFSDGLGYLLLIAAILVIIGPIVIAMLKGSGKK